MNWWIWAILFLVFVVIGPLLLLSFIIYYKLLVRSRKEPHNRECLFPENDEYARMFRTAEAWSDTYADCKTDVAIENDGLKLVGEYYDFGFQNAVIIIAGRVDSCRYSCYFAEPYRKAGCNVLVIDTRSHGLSEGRINSLGFKEYRDILLWSRLLHDRFRIEKVFYHGICIGGSAALFACTAPECPEYVMGMVAEGMYKNFFESTKNHMLEKNRPIFPFLYILMLHIRVFSGANAVTDGPFRRIESMKKPILFLHSREDIYSVPELAQQLYDRCGSESKRLVWFDKGAHSMVRINNTEKYDAEVTRFLSEHM